MTELKKHVSGQVHFQYFRDGNFWYETDSGLRFPVPVEDIGTAALNRDDKALLFMRWIRKWIIVLEKNAA